MLVYLQSKTKTYFERKKKFFVSNCFRCREVQAGFSKNEEIKYVPFLKQTFTCMLLFKIIMVKVVHQPQYLVTLRRLHLLFHVSDTDNQYLIKRLDI